MKPNPSDHVTVSPYSPTPNSKIDIVARVLRQPQDGYRCYRPLVRGNEKRFPQNEMPRLETLRILRTHSILVIVHFSSTFYRLRGNPGSSICLKVVRAYHINASVHLQPFLMEVLRRRAEEVTRGTSFVNKNGE